MKTSVIVIVVLNIALALAQLGLSAFRATDGATLSKIDQQTVSIQLENSRLQDQIYSWSAIPAIQSRAQALQLVPVSNAYLTLESPVAQAR